MIVKFISRSSSERSSCHNNNNNQLPKISMDPNNLDKWKEDFALKQENNMLKAKEIQRETVNRRRTMEMKARLEMAKEEQRRQEALADRRAHHVEATMRLDL